MNRSESIVNLSKALLKFQSEITKIKKGSKNPLIGNKYASLPEILDVIDPVLSECGIILNQFPDGNGEKVNLITLISHAESGEFMESSFSMTPVKIVKGSGAMPSIDPQSIGSCITYMRRYAITSILKLNVDDDDGNKASDVKEEDFKPAAQQKVAKVAEVAQAAKAAEVTEIAQAPKAAPSEAIDAMIKKIDYAQSIEELDGIAKELAKLEKTPAQREVLLKAYKTRKEYIQDVEALDGFKDV